ncbi:MAG: alginate export family protein, partial [Bacteroidota bacterium]
MGNDISRSSLLLTLLICFTLFAHGQTGASFQDERAKEDYSFLKDSTQLTWQDAIKFIRLDEEGNSYLSFGASLRTRFEHFTNNSWLADNNQNYYSQRITFHTDVHLGKHVRFFGELQHGYKSDGVSFLQTDDIDLHQGFIELKTSSSNPFSFRFGRQEMKLGVGRLIDLRVGPNVRRAFDMAKISFDHENVKIGAFYGNEVQIDFGAFDNDFNFFEQLTTNPKVWSINAKILTSKSTIIGRSIDVYYLGFQSTTAAFSDVVGEETRHSMGIRSYGKIGTRFQYNTELIYQFGDI